MLATVPSVTAISRTSLLTGTLRTGGQAEEKRRLRRVLGQAQVRALPQGRPRPRARPFPRQAGPRRDRRAPTPWSASCSTRSTTPWTRASPARPTGPSTRSRTCARSSTRHAARAARSSSPPTTATSSSQGPTGPRSAAPANAAQSDSARYRTGTPGTRRDHRARPARRRSGGEVVAAVDETIHYTPRQAGYHGGASPAEVVVPVITLLPSDTLLPPGWYAYDAAGHAPPGGTPRRRVPRSRRHPTRPRTRPGRRGRAARRAAAAVPDGNALFDVTEAATHADDSRPASGHPRRPGRRVAPDGEPAAGDPPSPRRGQRRRADRRARPGRRHG